MIELVYLNRAPQSQYKYTTIFWFTKPHRIFSKNFLYPKRDSNSHDRSHWFLRPTRLPLRHRGGHHIVQAFYSQLRGIVSYLTRLTAVWVPEDMICSPAWTRTTNYCLEGSSYIPLTTGPNFCTEGGTRTLTAVYWPRDFKSLVATITPPRHCLTNIRTFRLSDNKKPQTFCGDWGFISVWF